MARAARDGRRRFGRRRRDASASEQEPERDLTAFVGDYLIPEDQRVATSHWHPSRRGNSPHHRDA
jgi:hypothetical protein